MLFFEGESVKYKHIVGSIAFIGDEHISILVSKSEHRSKDVRVVVYKSDYKLIESLEQK